MISLDQANGPDPLDLLRRMVSTPHRTRFRSGKSTVVVETNDFSLLPAFPLETSSDDFTLSNLDWKLVRDPDVHGLLQEPLHLLSGPLSVVAMGPACLLGVDHERGELFCFIGADVDARTFQEFLVPFLCRLSMEPRETNSLGWVEGLKEDLADA